MDRSSASSPVSSPPLSLPDSDEFEVEKADRQLRPAKRQRIGDNSLLTTSALGEQEDDALSFISSDTDGDVPQSPGAARVDEEDSQEQVTACEWEGCHSREFGNMDKLVEHIHDEHIEAKQKRYTCEWSDCIRKSMPHASAYALKAHMRSHTREKPFYCALPECDRSFTRSDALAKHMRTVHETEALRPSDPIPKSMQPFVKNGTRLKLVLKQNNDYTNGEDQSPGSGSAPSTFPDLLPPPSGTEPGYMTPLTAELGFTSEEVARGPHELYRLLRRQVHWSEEESEILQRECESLDELLRREWLEKEILLDQVIQNDIDWHERRKTVLASIASVDEMRLQAQTKVEANNPALASVPSDDQVDSREAAAVLATLHQS